MAEPDLGPLADTVRRLDPELFRTALFAREPGREALFTLYAFDIELSRAVHHGRRSEAGPLIGQMRLQFWRDTVAEAATGGAARAHEVAEPLHNLIACGRVAAPTLEAMIDGHARELDGPEGADGFLAWALERFAARTEAAATLLGAPLPDGLGSTAARLLGADLALRSAGRMAGEGRSLVPGLGPADLAALAQGTLTDGAQTAVQALAALALPARGEGRRQMLGALGRAPSAGRPALLPLWRALRTVRHVSASPEAVARGIAEPSPALQAAAHLWIALTGRWRG